MNVLLVVYDNDSYIHWFPEGLAYIAAVLKKAGHQVVIYTQDKGHYPDEHLTEYLNHNRFDMVGLSVTGGYYQYRRLLQLSAAINASRQRPYYVIGGHGPAPEPDYFLRKTQADAVVIGEGEETVIELLEALGDPLRLAKVQGIAFRDGERVTVNERRPLISAIDSIPFPAYELFPMDYYRLLRMPHCENRDFVMPMLSGRGCPFTCNFCYRLDKGFRPREPEPILDEIRLLQKEYRISYIAFGDELLMSSVKRTQTLCEAFLRSGLRFKWDCNGRLNFAKPELLKLMKQSGCVFINYGIEAMDNQILRNMRKALTTEVIVKGIEATLAAGISPGFNIIFGNIGESEETLRKGVEFLLKYGDAAQMRTIRPVTPYPGSPLYYEAIEKGLLKDCAEFYEKKHVNSDLLAVNFTSLSDAEFHRALRDANLRLIEDYFEKQRSAIKRQLDALYIEGNANFRGFRPS
jgi:anaerobic magnesium-protoporphyrin IX monomethyl ester cyclase